MDNQKLLTCYTIGHSDREISYFISLLKEHAIEYVVDIRSKPYSNRFPNFDRESLKSKLKDAKIEYIFLGDKLGGIYNDSSLFIENEHKVDFIKVSKTKFFKDGLNRIINGLEKNYKIALMCVEKDPLDCHRFLLVSRELSKKGIMIEHIIQSGITESNQQTERRLMEKYKMNPDQMTLFDNKEISLSDAYIRRNKEIAKIIMGEDYY